MKMRIYILKWEEKKKQKKEKRKGYFVYKANEYKLRILEGLELGKETVQARRVQKFK